MMMKGGIDHDSKTPFDSPYHLDCDYVCLTGVNRVGSNKAK